MYLGTSNVLIASRTFFVHSLAMSDIERVQYKFMMPVHMKEALEEAAHDNRRSLSAEIISRLYQTLDMDETGHETNSQTISAALITEIVDKTMAAMVKSGWSRPDVPEDDG